MAAAGLGGAAMAAPVMGYDAIAVLEEEQHLRVPVIGRQRPAVAEHDGLTFAPILVEDLNAVFRGDRAHVARPSAKIPSATRGGIAAARRRRSKSEIAQPRVIVGPPAERPVISA